MLRSENEQNERNKRFLSEALPLVATYFSGSQVELSSGTVEIGTEFDEESNRFIQEIRLRHALSCCAELVRIVELIETRVSSVNEIVRTETKGLIKGRLDIPRYVVNHIRELSWPKRYPILVSESTPNTPENAFALRIMENILSRLNTSKLPQRTAEIQLARWYRRWISNKLHQDPWCNVGVSGSLKRLKQETSRRLARRQTGNEYGYSKLLSLSEEWGLQEYGSAINSTKIIEALFAFPSDTAYNDRIFEIWCLRELARAFENLGAERAAGPLPLHNNQPRIAYPIYIYELHGIRFEIWFQKALDASYARWTYTTTKKAFQGKPDITVVADNKYYFLLDAKNRFVTNNTRPEETYKILGYFENYRDLLNIGWAVLCFVSNDSLTQQLKSTDGGLILLSSAHPSDPALCNFSRQLESFLSEWIKSIKSKY
jgi:hypothetical protein